jgi:hypothetical protein
MERRRGERRANRKRKIMIPLGYFCTFALNSKHRLTMFDLFALFFAGNMIMKLKLLPGSTVS